MNTFGEKFAFTSFGESHGRAIGGVLDGVPAGLHIDLEMIKQELDGHGVKYTASQVKYIGACVSNEYFTERNFAS